MPDLRLLLYRLRNLWRRQAREAELDAELQFHLEAEAEEQIAAGLPADDARRADRGPVRSRAGQMPGMAAAGAARS